MPKFRVSSIPLLILLASLGATGCGMREEAKSSSGTNLSSGGGSSGTTNSIAAALYLKVESAWDFNENPYKEQVLCTIPMNSAPVSTTCNVKIPEGELYFSKLKFTYGTGDGSQCKIYIFQPFYYRGTTTDNSYLPPWLMKPPASGFTCVADPTPDCWHGPATLVPDFPDYAAWIYTTADGFEGKQTVRSAYSSGYVNNRWTANNKTNKAAGIAGEYVANSMVDWAVECRDEWYELIYKLTLTISDEDLNGSEDPGGPGDHFADWQ